MPGCLASPSPLGLEPKRLSDVDDDCVMTAGVLDVEKAVALVTVSRRVAIDAVFMVVYSAV
jgi:hypothetical protein